MRMIPTEIPEVLIIEPKVFKDDRGWFMESFQEEQFHLELKKRNMPIPRRFIQDNHSFSKKNVLRGLHFQTAPHSQGKLVRVMQGAVYDVAVDLRPKSQSFGKSVGIELSAKNKRMLWIPEGFAHGFLTLKNNTHFLYKTTDIYHQASEVCIRWDDSDLAIQWPLKNAPLLNDKDKMALGFKETMKPFLSKQVSLSKSFNLKIIGDARGSLVALEKGCNLPFNIERVYYIFNTQEGVSRGFHAHRKLQQLLICVAGTCRVIIDDGHSRKNVCLNSPMQGLYINHMVWREIHDFSKDCILVVCASALYDEADYIRDYSQFIQEIST